jgi:hypothetical protein
MGLILTEMLTDRPPLQGAEVALIFQQIVDRVRPTPAKFGVMVGAWEAVIGRALAVSPSERYRNAGELLGALDASVGGARPSRVSVSPGASAWTTGGGPLELAATRNASEVASGRAHLTTSSPVAGRASSTQQRRGSRSVVYAAGAGLALAAVAGVGWRVSTNRLEARLASGIAPTQPAEAASPAPLSGSTATPIPPELTHDVAVVNASASVPAPIASASASLPARRVATLPNKLAPAPRPALTHKTLAGAQASGSASSPVVDVFGTARR